MSNLKRAGVFLYVLACVLVPVAPAHAHGAAAWGSDKHYQLGTGYHSKGGSTVPVPMETANVAKIVTGGEWYAALRIDGTVIAGGGNEQGQSGQGTKSPFYVHSHVVPVPLVKELAGSGEHVIAVLADGRVATWGSDLKGQACNGQHAEGKVDHAVLSPYILPGITTAVAAAAGGADSYILLADGTVLACGENNAGQLGDGSTTDRSRPVAVKGLAGVTQIAAGGFAIIGTHLQALKADGTVWGVGRNNEGQLGTGAPSFGPVSVPVKAKVEHVTSIATAPDHTLAIVEGGAVDAWGASSVGQLGAAGTSKACGGKKNPNECAPTPQPVPGVAGAIAVSAGPHYSLVSAAGLPYGFGGNTTGVLGDGTRVAHTTPAAITGLAGVSSFAAGEVSAYAVTDAPVVPVISATGGKGTVTVSWVSGSSEPWHVSERLAGTKAWGTKTLLPGSARSYTFHLAAGEYEVLVNSKGYGQRIAFGRAT